MMKKLFLPWRWFKKRSLKTKAVILIFLVIVGFVGYKQTTGSKTPDYETTPAELADVVELVSESGNVTTAGAAGIFSTTTGIVEQVYVKNGDYVEKDQPIFTVRATATKQQQDAALATYLTAKNALEAAKTNEISLQAAMFTKWDSFKDLAESDDYEDADNNPKEAERNLPEFRVPQNEWLAAEAAYKNQQQVVTQAQVNSSAAWKAYQATQDGKITANLSGTVMNLAVAPGDMVIVQSATNASPALLLVDTNIVPMIKMTVSETDALKVSPGQQASIEFDAIKDKVFPGHVDRVDTVAVPVQGVVNYSVYIALDDTDQNIQSGMTADVDVVVTEKTQVLTVPSSAVKPYEGGRAVRIVGTNGEIEYIPVTIGAKGDGKTEILSGIDEGTQVIVALKNDQVKRSGGLF